MLRFDKNKPNKIQSDKNKSIISDKHMYRRAINEEVVEEKPVDLSENFENINKIIKVLRNEVYRQSPKLQFSKNIVDVEPALASALDENYQMDRKVADCIKRTYINTAMNDITNTDSSGLLNVKALEEDIWWKIGYARAMESLAKKLLGLLISAVLSTIFMQLNRYVKMFAEALGNIKIKFTILFISICINIGIVLQAIVIMFVHYYIYELIRLFEQFGWCYLTYHNEKTGQSRTTNIFIDLFGSVVDKGFYPKYTAPHLQNENNKSYHQTLIRCEAAPSLILNITFGWTPVCHDININDLKDIGDNTNTLLQFVNYFRSDEKTAVNAVNLCVECRNDCNEFTFSSSDGIDKINTSIQLNQMLSAMSAHNITGTDEGIYNDISNLLDDMESNANSQLNSLKLHDSLSENIMPISALTEFNTVLAKMEMGLKKVSSFLSNVSNKQFIDLTPSKIKNTMLQSTKEALTIELNQYNKQLKTLNKKVSEIDKQLKIALKEKAVIEEEYYNNPLSITKKNSLKLVNHDIESLDKSRQDYSVEIENIKDDISDIKEELKVATDKIAEPLDAVSYRKTLMADSAVIFALDLVCCVLSLLLGLLMKQYDRDPEKFKEITDSFWYKILAEGQSDLIKETSPYVGLQMSIRMIDFIFSVIGGVQISLDSESEASYNFDANIDIIGVATEMAGNTAFTSVDTFIKLINEMVFSQGALLEKPPYWELRKINDAERTYLESTTPVIGNNAFNSLEELYKKETSNASYFETPYGLMAFILKDNSLNQYVKTDTTFIIESDKSLFYEVYHRVCPTEETNEFEELIAMLLSGKCISLNFLFDFLLGYIKDFHTTLLVFKLLLEYEPSFNIHASITHTSAMKIASFSAFSNLLDLLANNLDFFIKLCNLEQTVNDVSELRETLNKMVDDEINRSSREMEVFDGIYEKRRTYLYDPFNYNEDDYVKLVEQEYNLPVSFEKKKNGGLLSERASNAWDYIMETKVVSNTSRINEEIIGGNNE